ncbi:HupE/UreJ family protein [Chryseolinea soli]|nr:HupE/UreJ family protein [Chryseolinea soli]
MGQIKLPAAVISKCILTGAMFVLGLNAVAHPMPNSVVSLSVLEKWISGEVKIPLLELESAIGRKAGELDTDFFREYFESHIQAVSGKRTWHTEIESLSTITDTSPFVGEYQEVVVHFKLTPPDARLLRHFTFEYDAVIHQVITHRALVFVQYDWNNGLQDQSDSEPLGVIGLDVPSGKIFPLEVHLEEGSWINGVKGMFLLGMKHIREGLDHILFLLTLLLIAPLTIEDRKWSGYQGFRYTLERFLKISLAFTLGHSITLLAGSLNLVDFRVQYVEVLIAVSILVSAVNCVKPVFFKKEVFIAGGFGLIHGLAFSISLSHLELGLGSKLLSIVGFNLGIEAMQLIIMACFLPMLLMSKWKAYPAVRTAFAVFTIILSTAWIVERIATKENFITAHFNKLL